MNCGERIRVVHYKDIVPHLPFQMMGFHHADSEIFYSNEPRSSYSYCENSEDDQCSDQYQQVPLNWNYHRNYMNFAPHMNC